MDRLPTCRVRSTELQCCSASCRTEWDSDEETLGRDTLSAAENQNYARLLQGKNGERRGRRPTGTFAGNCLRCGNDGHLARDYGARVSFASEFSFKAAVTSQFRSPASEYLPLQEAATHGFAALDCGATSSVGGLGAVRALAHTTKHNLGRDTTVDAYKESLSLLREWPQTVQHQSVRINF